MTGRIGCCIPGCRRTFKRESGDGDDVEIMCRRHWRMGELRPRARYKRGRKLLRKIERLGQRHAIRAKGQRRIWRAMDAAGAIMQAAFAAIKEDVTIKAAFGAENAPRRKPRSDQASAP